MKRLPALYAIADASFGDPVDISRRLFNGGARLVQVRNKTASSGELLDQVVRIIDKAPPDARLIVNDRADIAKIVRAAGVHLGQEDLSPSAARRILDDDSIVGVSTHDVSQALDTADEPVDYVAVGPVFESSTKKNHAPVLGLDGLAAICGQLERPVVAIGGIRLEHLEEVLAAGASSVAVISDLVGHPAIEERTGKFLDRLAEIERA